MSKSRIYFRFTLNQAASGGIEAARKSARQGVNAVLRNIVVSYAKNTATQIEAEIKSKLEMDVKSEISHMAGLFKRATIGIGGNSKAPNGFASMAHPMSTYSQGKFRPSAAVGPGIDWGERSDRYLSWKKRKGYGKKWYRNEGRTIGPYLGQVGNWTRSFGGIQVRIEKGRGAGSGGSFGRMSNRDLNESKGGRITYGSIETSTVTEHLLTVRISALTDITPSMLPGLRTGQMGAYADGRKSGLMSKLPADVAVRLGGPGKYRHTIEPFLTFLLTRAVPNAMFLRVERGLKAKGLATNRKS